jgi:hypothetical protein
MRPRVFPSSEKALARACADLRRASACATLEPQRRLNRFACSLAILALVWAGTTGAGAYWHYLIAHAISAAPLDHAVWVTAGAPWQIGEQRNVTLPTGQQMKVTYKGEIAMGGPSPTWAELALGDMYKYGSGYWVWAIPPGGYAPTWIDP